MKQQPLDDLLYLLSINEKTERPKCVEGAELVLKRDASTWTCQQHVKIHPLSFSTPKHACSYNRRRGEGQENIKLYIYGVTTPVTNSFIQCKSVHKASCIRAPGKKKKKKRVKFCFSTRRDSTCLDSERDALSSHWTLTFDVKELKECILSWGVGVRMRIEE